MIRRSFRVGLMLGVLGGLAFALVKMLGSRSAPSTDPVPAPVEPWPRLRPEPAATPIATPAPAPAEPAATPVATPAPAPVEPAATPAMDVEADVPTPTPVAKPPAKKAPAKKPVPIWIEPTGGVCPTSHPVKAKLASKIFHLPGMLNYERTNPDRCYRDASGAEADGLRAAKR